MDFCFLSRSMNYFISIFILIIVSGCFSDRYDDLSNDMFKSVRNVEEISNGAKLVDMNGVTDITLNSKYPKKYSKFVSYNIDRSYINSVDYPMSMEAYYISRFTNKKDDITKPPFYVTPISSKIKEIHIDEVVDNINRANNDLTLIKDELLMIRKKYIEILSISKHCCSYGLMTKFESIGVDKDYIFKFMIDDKRLYELQNICMLINDNDIANLLGSVELSVITRDVRNSCICKNKDTLERHLELFKAIIGKTNLFKRNNIIFKYTNELGEVIKNSIGRDTINLLNALGQCP